MQVRSADGVMHEFPDGTDMAVVDRVMKNYATGTAAPAEPLQPVGASPAADQSLRDAPAEADPFRAMRPLRRAVVADDYTLRDAGRDLQIGAQGTGSGLAKAVSAPFDLMAGAQNLITRGINAAFDTNIPYATPASDMLQAGATKAFQAVGGTPIPREQMSPRQRLAYDVSDYGTQGVVTGGALATMAPARAASLAEGATPRMADAFVRPYFNNAPSVVAGDAASGVGSGVAMNAVEENKIGEGQWYKPLVDAGAVLAGGVGGAALKEGVQSGGRMVKDAFVRGRTDKNIPADPTTLQPVTRGQSETASRMMQEVASNPDVAAANIRENAATMRAADLPQPTIGLVSDDVGLQSAETAARTKKGVPFIENDNKLRAAATERVESLRDPKADQSQPAAIARTEATMRTTEARRGASQGIRDAETLAQTDVQAAERAAAERIAAAQARAAEAEGGVRTVEQQNQQYGAPIAASANTDAKAQASRRLDTTVVDQGYIPARTEKNRQFDTAPGRTEQLPADDVIAAAQRVRQNINDLGPERVQLPAEFVQRLERLAPDIQQQPSAVLGPDGRPLTREVNVGGPGTAQGQDLADVRKYLGTAYEQAQRAGNFDLADNIASLRRAINTTIEAAPGYTEANANYRQFADTFRPSPNDEAAKFTRQIDRDPARGSTPPSETAGRFLAGPEKAQALQRMMGDSPNGQNAVRDYLRSDFGMVALNPDGTLNPNRAASWGRNNADILAQFPALRGEFDNMVATARRGEQLSAEARANLDAARGELTATERSGRDAVRGAERTGQETVRTAERTGQQAVKATEDEINRSVIGTLLKEDPRDTARRIFGSQSYGAEKELDEIKKLIGADKQANRGWKAAVSEVLADTTSGTAKIDAGKAGTSATYRTELGKLDKQFKQNEALLAKVYDPDEMNKLQQAHAVLEPLKNASVRATSGSNTADKSAQMWRLAEAGLKAKYGILKGGGYLRTLRVMAQTLPDDSAAVQRVIERAWFDPDLASYLLTNKVRDLSADASNKHVRRLLAGSAAARDSD